MAPCNAIHVLDYIESIECAGPTRIRFGHARELDALLVSVRRRKNKSGSQYLARFRFSAHLDIHRMTHNIIRNVICLASRCSRMHIIDEEDPGALLFSLMEMDTAGEMDGGLWCAT